MVAGKGRGNLNCSSQKTPTTNYFNSYLSDLCYSGVKAHPSHALLCLLQGACTSIQRPIDYARTESNNFMRTENSNKNYHHKIPAKD